MSARAPSPSAGSDPPTPTSASRPSSATRPPSGSAGGSADVDKLLRATILEREDLRKQLGKMRAENELNFVKYKEHKRKSQEVQEQLTTAQSEREQLQMEIETLRKERDAARAAATAAVAEAEAARRSMPLSSGGAVFAGMDSDALERKLRDPRLPAELKNLIIAQQEQLNKATQVAVATAQERDELRMQIDQQTAEMQQLRHELTQRPVQLLPPPLPPPPIPEELSLKEADLVKQVTKLHYTKQKLEGEISYVREKLARAEDEHARAAVERNQERGRANSLEQQRDEMLQRVADLEQRALQHADHSADRKFISVPSAPAHLHLHIPSGGRQSSIESMDISSAEAVSSSTQPASAWMNPFDDKENPAQSARRSVPGWDSTVKRVRLSPSPNPPDPLAAATMLSPRGESSRARASPSPVSAAASASSAHSVSSSSASSTSRRQPRL